MFEPMRTNPHDVEIAELAGWEEPCYDNFWLKFYLSISNKLFFNTIFVWLLLPINLFSLFTFDDFGWLWILSFALMIIIGIQSSKELNSIFGKFYHKGLKIRAKEDSKAEEHAWNSKLKLAKKSIEAGGIKKLKEAIEIIRTLSQQKQSGFMFGETISGPDRKIEIVKGLETEAKTKLAKQHEKLMEFDEAAEIYKELDLEDEVIKVRKLKSEEGAVKVTQKVVHGDEVTKTEIKDSVLNRSNVGGGSSKMQELEKLAEMKDKGIIDDDEFKQMKKEILGK
jgi:hypothetical protein